MRTLGSMLLPLALLTAIISSLTGCSRTVNELHAEVTNIKVDHFAFTKTIRMGSGITLDRAFLTIGDLSVPIGFAFSPIERDRALSITVTSRTVNGSGTGSIVVTGSEWHIQGEKHVRFFPADESHPTPYVTNHSRVPQVTLGLKIENGIYALTGSVRPSTDTDKLTDGYQIFGLPVGRTYRDDDLVIDQHAVQRGQLRIPIPGYAKRVYVYHGLHPDPRTPEQRREGIRCWVWFDEKNPKRAADVHRFILDGSTWITDTSSIRGM